MGPHTCGVATRRLRPAAAAVLVLTAACSSMPAAGPETVGAPSLPLLSSGALEIPRDCAMRSGVIYRTRFVVQPDGHVADVVAEAGPVCVREALAQWVGTFRYPPVAASVPSAIDWMAVTAKRGG